MKYEVSIRCSFFNKEDVEKFQVEFLFRTTIASQQNTSFNRRKSRGMCQLALVFLILKYPPKDIIANGN